MAALVYRLWGLRGVKNCYVPMSWPDPASVVRRWLQSWCRFISSKGTISPHQPPKPNMGSGCLQSWAGERYKAGWEKEIEAKMK